MDVNAWSVCIIEPSRFEANVVVDLLRNAGIEKYKVFTNSVEAAEALEFFHANIILGAVEMTPLGGIAWTRGFRRNQHVCDRKAPVFLTSRAFSRAMAEECRHAGANALIGKPLSNKILIATIAKVLANPRPFIDAAGYVGPCRRAGIVTAGEHQKRRRSDTAAAEEAAMLAQAFATLVKTLTDIAEGRAVAAADCDAAFRRVQTYAVNANDKPLMNVCLTLAQQLTAHDLRSPAGKAALSVCAAAIGQLAELDLTQTEARQRVAAGVHDAINKSVAAAQAA